MKAFAAAVVVILALFAFYKLGPRESAPVLKPVAVTVHEDSPSGRVYLLNYVSSVMPGGVIGWLPGQAVDIDRSRMAPTGYATVTDGQYCAVVPLSLLTADERVADALRRADEAMTWQSGAMVSTMNKAVATEAAAQERATAYHIERANAEMVASSTIGTYASALRHPAYRSTDSWAYTPPSVVIVTLPTVSTPVAAAYAPGNATVTGLTRGPIRLATGVTGTKYTGDHFSGTGISTHAPSLSDPGKPRAVMGPAIPGVGGQGVGLIAR